MASSVVHLIFLGFALIPGVYGAGLTKDPKDFTSRSYNYIIVGGGTAGLAVAARLSEDSKRVVGVIEAGLYLPDDPLINTPGLFGAATSQPAYDWMLTSTPQANLNGRQIPLPRGRVLGGSSAINFMGYDRASAYQYDDWDPYTGSRWKWKGILPYLKKAEDTLAPTTATPFDDPSSISPIYQGTGGPIKKSYNTFYSDVTKPYLDTIDKLGIHTNDNPDNGNATGVYNCAMSIDQTTGKRSYAASTYFVQAQSRPNFHILLGAEVSKVNLHGRTVKSVTFFVSGTAFNVSVTNDVILSAGSLKTPQILELSGFGNKSLLEKLGIHVIKDLPGVGENLQDHVLVANAFALKPGFTTFDILRNDPKFAAAQQTAYAENGTGMLAATHSAFSFFGLDIFLSQDEINAMFEELENELQASSLSKMDSSQYKIMRDQFKKTDFAHPVVEIIMFPGHYSPLNPQNSTDYISLLIANQHPWSRGSVHIKSSNPKDAPIIDPHYLERTFDARVLALGSKFARKIAQSQPLAQYIQGYHTPGADCATDQDFLDYVRKYTTPVFHPIGTAAIGPESLGGVVSNRLVVHGTSNLRVVDASVIPLHLATHIQQTVYAIAEQAADIIKSDNKGKIINCPAHPKPARP